MVKAFGISLQLSSSDLDVVFPEQIDPGVARPVKVYLYPHALQNSRL